MGSGGSRGDVLLKHCDIKCEHVHISHIKDHLVASGLQKMAENSSWSSDDQLVVMNASCCSQASVFL